MGVSWDDFRIVKAIGETGSLAAAASTLAVNTSTMARRLTQIEASLGVALFERRRTGYVATTAGAEVLALADRLELDIVSIIQRVCGQAQQYAGNLRIATSDSLALHFLTPIIADFRKVYPAIAISLVIGNRPLNLARGEADVVLRSTDAPPESLVGKKVSTIGWAAYGCKENWGDGFASCQQLRASDWISYGGSLSGLKANALIEGRISQHKIGYQCDSVEGVAAAIAANIGIGYLPCMIGDIHPGLTRIGVIEPSLSSPLWLLTHPDIRKVPRVHAFMTFCATYLTKHRAAFERGEPAADLLSECNRAFSSGGNGQANAKISSGTHQVASERPLVHDRQAMDLDSGLYGGSLLSPSTAMRYNIKG